jgi:hypothetical protein
VGAMMKLLKISSVVAIVLLIIIGGTYAIIEVYKSDKLDKLIYESDQNEKKQYDLMCQNIAENSDYYYSFSENFISLFEEYGYNEFHTGYGFFEHNNIKDELKYESNTDLLGSTGYIQNYEGFIHVVLDYPYSIKVFGYMYDDFTTKYFSDEYVVIYIPDEYMNEEIIDTLNTDVYHSTLKNIKDNLFVAWRAENQE